MRAGYNVSSHLRITAMTPEEGVFITYTKEINHVNEFLSYIGILPY